MRKTILILMAIVGIAFTAITCFAGDKDKTKKKMAPTTAIQKNMGQNSFQPCDSVIAQLGKTATEVIFNPSKVEVYRVEGRDSIGKDEVEIEKNYVRKDMIGTLSKDYIKLVQYLLVADPANYKDDDMRVRSPYLPDLEMRFIRKNQVVSILVSRSDFTWTLVSDGKKQFNYNYAEKSAIDRLIKQILKF
jgi:hypothetical protein